MIWHMCGLGVRATCGQRVTDIVKTSVYEHKLGARYIWQVMQSETLGELGRLKGQVMEWNVRAQDAAS